MGGLESSGHQLLSLPTGWISLARGDTQEARAHFEQAAEIRRQGDTLDYHVVASYALAALAPLVASFGEVELAEALAEEGVRAARHLWFRQILVMTLLRAVEVALLAGGLERAGAKLIEALGLLWDLGARRWVAESLELAAVVVAHQGHLESAARPFGACDALRVTQGEGAGEGRCIFAEVQACRHRSGGRLGGWRLRETVDPGTTDGGRRGDRPLARRARPAAGACCCSMSHASTSAEAPSALRAETFSGAFAGPPR